MTNRYRFYVWSVDDAAFAKLRRRITADWYTESSGQGFQLLRATRQEIEGRFVQKIAYIDEVLAPDGSILKADRISYVHTSFRLRPGGTGLLLLNPPRSTSAFLHRLSQLLDYEVAVQAAKINLIELKRSLQSKLGKAQVRSVKITGAPLAQNAVADIMIIDPQDALENAVSLFPEHRELIGKMELCFDTVTPSKIRISANRSGAISTSEESKETIDALWEAVGEATQ